MANRQDISCVLQSISNSNGAIYISNLKAAQNLQLLSKLKINSIVTVLRGARFKHKQQSIPNHLYIPADDVDDYNIDEHFSQTYQFIDRCRKNGNVLVHCYAGISRSVTIVVAYLMKKYMYSLRDVLIMIKRKRNKINPNDGFIQQLKKYATTLNKQIKQSKLRSSKQSKQKILSPQSKQQKDKKLMNTIQQILHNRKLLNRHKRSVSTFTHRDLQTKSKNQTTNNLIGKYIKIQAVKDSDDKKSQQIEQNVAKFIKLQNSRTKHQDLPEKACQFISYQSQMAHTYVSPTKNGRKSLDKKLQVQFDVRKSCPYPIQTSVLPRKSNQYSEKLAQCTNIEQKIQKLKQKILQNQHLRNKAGRSASQIFSEAHIKGAQTENYSQKNKYVNNFISNPEVKQFPLTQTLVNLKFTKIY